jgi:hypothetical protein
MSRTSSSTDVAVQRGDDVIFVNMTSARARSVGKVLTGVAASVLTASLAASRLKSRRSDLDLG